MQDSIIKLMGLKTISLAENGAFQQTDSFFSNPGKWVETDGWLRISNGGAGFKDFRGKVILLNDTAMQVREEVSKATDNIPLVWNLRRVDDKNESLLFGNEANWWRKKPVAPESDSVIRTRVVAALKYYAAYFKVVSDKANYFAPRRVCLPLRYYQHGVGMIPLEANEGFTNLFYNLEQANRAYDMISAGIDDYKDKFPSGDNYVIEYSMFFKQLAKVMEKSS